MKGKNISPIIKFSDTDFDSISILARLLKIKTLINIAKKSMTVTR